MIPGPAAGAGSGLLPRCRCCDAPSPATQWRWGQWPRSHRGRVPWRVDAKGQRDHQEGSSQPGQPGPAGVPAPVSAGYDRHDAGPTRRRRGRWVPPASMARWSRSRPVSSQPTPTADIRSPATIKSIRVVRDCTPPRPVPRRRGAVTQTASGVRNGAGAPSPGRQHQQQTTAPWSPAARTVRSRTTAPQCGAISSPPTTIRPMPRVSAAPRSTGGWRWVVPARPRPPRESLIQVMMYAGTPTPVKIRATAEDLQNHLGRDRGSDRDRHRPPPRPDLPASTQPAAPPPGGPRPPISRNLSAADGNGFRSPFPSFRRPPSASADGAPDDGRRAPLQVTLGPAS